MPDVTDGTGELLIHFARTPGRRTDSLVRICEANVRGFVKIISKSNPREIKLQ